MVYLDIIHANQETVAHQFVLFQLQVNAIVSQGHHLGGLSCATVQINRQAGVNGIGKYCGQYGLSKGKRVIFCMLNKKKCNNFIIHIERIDYFSLNVNLNRLAKGVQIIVKVAAKNGGSS